MENNEIKNEFKELENKGTDLVEVYDMEPEVSGGGIVKVLGVIGGLAAAGAAALYLTKDKREAKQIAKLEKKGYVVLTPKEVEECEEEAEEFEGEIVDEEPEEETKTETKKKK